MSSIRMDVFCSSVRDGTHDTPKPTETGYYLVTSRAVKNNIVDFSSCYYISPEDYEKINRRSKVDKWDVVMTMIGTVGRLLLVQDEVTYAIKNMALFKVGDEDRAKWLYYYLSTQSVQNYFEMVASGTSQHFIGLGHLRKLQVADYTEASKRIIDILSAYDELIEKNNRKIAILQEQAQELYKEWFVRFRFPGHETAKFVNGLPVGWMIYRFSEKVDVMSGGTPNTDKDEYYGGDIPFYTPKDSTESIFAFKTSTYLTDEGLKNCNSQYYPKNTIIVTARGTVGKTNILAVPMAMNQSCYALRLKEIDAPYFLYFALGEEIKKLQCVASGGVFDTIIVKTFNTIHITIPTRQSLQQFNQIVEPLMDSIQAIEISNRNLTRQRDLLLPRLMSGKLEVH